MGNNPSGCAGGKSADGRVGEPKAGLNGAADLPDSLTNGAQNPKNNIILMTDGYKFSHHKQYPVSWMPTAIRPGADGSNGAPDYQPPVLFPSVQLLALRPVPVNVQDGERVHKITVITNVSTAVVEVQQAAAGEAADFTYTGKPVTLGAFQAKSSVVVAMTPSQCARLRLPQTFTAIKFQNVDECKLKRGSKLNDNYEGGYNVSYLTPRGYSDAFGSLEGAHIVFFGLQYFIKEYLVGKVVTHQKIEEADAFVSRYMADVRIQGPAFEDGYDYTMFPRGDWEAIASGDYDATGHCNHARAGVLPIRIEALPEGSIQAPNVCSFKMTNTHPRFYWLPNYLETLLVQVWYPMAVATQAREFRKTIQAYSILSQRVAPPPLGPLEFTAKTVAEDPLPVHIAQVFDLLDFGYRGVSSHETAGLGSASYYTAGFEGSDTVAGSRMLLHYYNSVKKDAPEMLASFKGTFEQCHGATSIPAAEHSTITSWADVRPDADHRLYEQAEYSAFTNMIKQYMSSFAVSLVSDGFNIWNAVTNLWASEDAPDGVSMRGLLAERLAKGQLSLMRPDSGEGVETLPQLLTLLHQVLPEHWESEAPAMREVFPSGHRDADLYSAVLRKIRANQGILGDGNPFRRFKGQQMRVLQGDGVALDTVGDMLASLVANGFCANCVHFGSGGGLLQKLNRDSLQVAFKCCSMYVGNKEYPVGKDPIAGGKKSYGGNPPVLRGEDGVLRNRGQYDAQGNMTKAEPMSHQEFQTGVPGDVLQKVFEDGVVVCEQSFADVKERAKITNLDDALQKAVNNLNLKAEFFQRMSSDRAIAVRLAEASCGSKWAHRHETSLAEIAKRVPKYKPALEAIGVRQGMDSEAVLDRIRGALVCDRTAKKRILRALAEDDPQAAAAAMGDKPVITM